MIIELIDEDDHYLVTVHTELGKILPIEFVIEYFTSLQKKYLYNSY